MIGFFRAFIRVLAVIYYTIIYGYYLLFAEKFKGESRERTHKYTSKWGHSILKSLGVELKGDIPELPAGVLLLPNHRSYVDIFIVQALCPSSIVAKKEIGEWPVLKSVIRICEIILIDRSNLRSRFTIAREVKEKTRQGQSVILFPEGTTAIGPQLIPLKKGTFKIAIEEKISILPLAIEYKHRDMAWIDDSLTKHFFKVFRRKKNPVKFIFGQPIFGTETSPLIDQYKKWLETHTQNFRNEWDSHNEQSSTVVV